MKNSFFQIVSTFLLLAILVSCGDDATFEGNGIPQTEERTLDGFNSLDISGVFDVEVSQDDNFSVIVESDNNLLENVITRVDGETLVIDLETGSYDNFNIKIWVAMPLLVSVDASEVGDISIDGFEDLETLSIDQAGLGDLTLVNGSADRLDVDKAGIGNLNAFDFPVKTCNIDMAGIGNVEVTCSETLQGSISGIGDLYYKGMPTIDVDRSGIGEIIDAN